MQIFIETNKSLNEYVTKENYCHYDESIHLSPGRTASTASDVNPYMILAPDEAFKMEHQIKIEHGPGSQEYQVPGYEMLSPEDNFINDFDKVQNKLKQIIYESIPITMDEKAEIVSIMNDSSMRTAVTEVL